MKPCIYIYIHTYIHTYNGTLRQCQGSYLSQEGRKKSGGLIGDVSDRKLWKVLREYRHYIICIYHIAYLYDLIF